MNKGGKWMNERIEMFQVLTEAAGVSGHEKGIRAIIRQYAEQYAEIETDNLGSIICRKTGSQPGPRIMLPGHIDEIGFMVSHITKEGFVKFVPLGGWWEQVMLAQRVVIKSRNGDVTGVIGSKPPHILTAEERKKMVEKKDMFIDIGAASAAEAKEEFGVRPGDPIVPVCPFEQMRNPKYMMAKAWDDRVGCALFIDVIKELAKTDHPNTVFGVGTVQEEVGLRGAGTAADVVKPDVCLTLDVTVAGDIPGMKQDEMPNEKLGKGPVILLADGSALPNVQLRDFAVTVAEANDIPYQFSALMGGGTDSGRVQFHRSGVPTLVIGMPTRYIHSHTSIINYDDYENTLRLLLAMIKKMDAATVRGFTE
jgi:putative aminopeptidase FrvX